MTQEADVLRRLIGQSPPMRELVHLIRLVAPTPLTGLIRGERGTGKELVADALTHIQALGQVSVGELAREREVSAEAIRRDLAALVALGILRKFGTTSGGAPYAACAVRVGGGWPSFRMNSPGGR